MLDKIYKLYFIKAIDVMNYRISCQTGQLMNNVLSDRLIYIPRTVPIKMTNSSIFVRDNSPNQPLTQLKPT